jgi:hypothetical protein
MGRDYSVKCLLAARVEIGIGIVEHEQRRPAVDSACKSDPLALPA